ncbi:ABC transporter ATP-binding protein [Microbacterium sp. NPDC076911]|uniref:ABC transporter ATP-binding protein n=1 Tax=Microbacterium sp. NPDC076911 TaxID=3154958 RepID=UPI00343DA78F
MNGSEIRPAAVSARGWGWRHASRAAWALRDVSFRIEPGERVLLLGASGAGKSTLMHALAGVLGGDDEGEAEGELLVDGVPAAAARGRAGLVLQDPDSQVILARVGDDVAFGCENLGVPRDEIWQRVESSLDQVGLDVSLDRSTAALSGGQKQRLALAGVLAMRPGLVLLDEPTANLDPAGVAEVQRSVASMLASSDSTLVVVEHRLDVWLPLVTRVIVLGEAGVVADGTPGEVLSARGQELAESGVWVPGIPPAFPPPPAYAPGPALLSADDMTVARVKGRTVASGISLDIREGEAVAITGPNGVGKSTVGLTLAGLLAPSAGRLTAGSTLRRDAAPSPIKWSSKQLLTRIGTVFQHPEHQLLEKTVHAELEVGPRALGLPEGEIAVRVDEVMARLRLERLARANPYTLSGGEKRRLTVGAALVTRPRVLVLDEPTFGQDARTWAELIALLARLRDEGSAIVTITHDADVVAALAATRFEMASAVQTL